MEFARQSDLDRLTAQVEKFVEITNKLFITKELHTVAQEAITEKLSKIEIFIEKSQENFGKRLEALEKKDLKRKHFKTFSYALAGGAAALSSVHWKTIIQFLVAGY